MEILQTEVEIPESEEQIGFKDPTVGLQHPFFAVIRSKHPNHYKFVILFLTSLYDECNCTLETQINVLIDFKYTGPPLQPSDLFFLYWIGNLAAKKKMTGNKVFQFGSPNINWQSLPVQILYDKLQVAIDKMNAKSN